MAYGLALSGGSLRGAIHIGILEILLRENLPPQMIAGTSAGSIVGSLYAAGIVPRDMEKIFSQLLPQVTPDTEFTVQPLAADPDQSPAISWLPLPQGLINANFIETLLTKFIGSVTFEELACPLAVTATDLHTGELVVFTAEYLIPPQPWPPHTVFVGGAKVAAAVRASSAIPGVFTPKTIGQRILLDGGLVNNVPADILNTMGAEKIMAVDLGFGRRPPEHLKNLIEILLQTYDIMGQRITNLITAEHAQLVLRPRGVNAGLLDFHKLPQFIAVGRRLAEAELPRIKAVLSK